MKQGDEKIFRYRDVELSHAVIAELDSIFFEASATRTFQNDTARTAFRHRWLGRYLEFNPGEAFLAFAGTNSSELAGYLVGALADPATDPHQQDLGYFKEFAPLTRRYPAHLHVNVAMQYRTRNIGARLLETFIAHAGDCGAPGVHVVTGKGMRNVGFYERNGFLPLAEAPWNGRTVLMLGRSIGQTPKRGLDIGPIRGLTWPTVVK